MCAHAPLQSSPASGDIIIAPVNVAVQDVAYFFKSVELLSVAASLKMGFTRFKSGLKHRQVVCMLELGLSS